jgi:hypothetical protein
MKVEIRKVDEARVTTPGERWYVKEVGGKETFVPSVTWICDYLPKGVGFYKWLANKGWDEAEALKASAADKGSKVHNAIARLLDGFEVKIDERFPNSDGVEEDLRPEEYEAIMSFVDWFNEVKPEILAHDMVVWGEKDSYAGTLDLLCRIKGEAWLVDFKTSQSVWPSHHIQVTAYAMTPDVVQPYGQVKLAILQLGYRLNKKKYKFNEIEPKPALFEAARTIWKSETDGVVPQQKDYPVKLKLNK